MIENKKNDYYIICKMILIMDQTNKNNRGMMKN